MALIKCPECGSSVSDRATSCIHCGCPLAGGTNPHQIKIRTPAAGSDGGEYIFGNFRLVDMNTQQVIATVPQGGTFDITSEKALNLGLAFGLYSIPHKKCCFTVSPGKKYKLSWTVSWMSPAIVCNEVDHLDSD